ncbi:hypothetical protein FA15DRAFT_671567 [Coprinopsis marcescibilis]|uniref:EF-hand domain-containing protein n=1 Tax=Coprinopsis marcescibilis TaxID=230819 RepID=A0A5C3KQG4_COPMA|nr:hypothetical protein FA15DRAFT_671567 [Coprinopsis marcescibilis]
MVESDSVFFSLSKPLQRRIDHAFTKILDSISPEKLSSSFSGGGGFIVDDADDEPPALDAQIPLDLVPSALQYLDFPADDDQVLSVFRNAAMGWKSSTIEYPSSQEPSTSQVKQLGVNLEDWRSVCAVLLENDDDDDDEQDEEEDNGMDVDDDDMYNEDFSESSDENVNDEDFELGPRVRRTRRTAGNRSPSVSLSSSSPKPARTLTPHQKQAALDTYALFFPSVPTESLKDQKIMINDIQRVADLLKEKLKAQEIMDMIEMFSTSSDKSISFADFTRMLTVARLV